MTYAESSGAQSAEELSTTTKRKRKTKKDVGYAESDQLSELSEEDQEVDKFTPKKGRKKAPPKKVKQEEANDGEAKEKTPKKATPKKSRVAKDEPEFDEDGNEVLKKKRKVREYPKKVYEIPEVEKKETTFKGWW